MTQAVACEGAILVGLVLLPCDLMLAQPGFDFAAVDFEQRTDESFTCHGQNPGKAGETGPAQDPVKHGLGLIGSSVAGGDAVHQA